MKAPDERDVAHLGDKLCSFRAEDIAKSAEFRQLYASAANIVSPPDQPFERSPDGLIKHLVNPRMNTRECCIDAYMQFLPPGGRAASTGICGKRSSSSSRARASTSIGT